MLLSPIIVSLLPLQRSFGVLHVVVDAVQLVDLPVQFRVDSVRNRIHLIHVLSGILQTLEPFLLQPMPLLYHLLPLVGALALVLRVLAPMLEQVVLPYLFVAIELQQFFELVVLGGVLLELRLVRAQIVHVQCILDREVVCLQ